MMEPAGRLLATAGGARVGRRFLAWDEVTGVEEQGDRRVLLAADGRALSTPALRPDERAAVRSVADARIAGAVAPRVPAEIHRLRAGA